MLLALAASLPALTAWALTPPTSAQEGLGPRASMVRAPRGRLSLSAASHAAPAAAALGVLAAAAKDDIRGVVDASAANALLPESAYWIGAAFREWLGSSDPIVAGRDPRLSSAPICEAFCRGAQARDAGAATTPAMLEALLGPSAPYCGAVMVTASHLPAEWNGLKLFSRQLARGLNKKEVKEVMGIAVERARSGVVLEHAPVLSTAQFMSSYIEKLKRAVCEAAQTDALPLRGMKICVNPGNGAGGFFAAEVLAPLGADISPSINLEPDGSFPAHMPNPEEKAHVDATMSAVAASFADVGVMLDTDVDRCGLIDGMRYPPEPVNTNRLIALCARVALEAAGGKGVIVTDPVTSAGMAQYIRECGGEHDRFKMGYRNVIDRAAEMQPEPALLAIETSGHSAWRVYSRAMPSPQLYGVKSHASVPQDNAFVDDGTYTAARLIGRLARARAEQNNVQLGLLDLVGDSLQEPKESIKVKMSVASGLPGVAAAEVALCAALRQCADATQGWEIEPVNHDGLRCAVGNDGWLIIRGSLHEPSVSVQTESDIVGGTAAICARLLEFVLAGGQCEMAGLDVQPLRNEAEKAT